jgi:hypothetical protein
MNSFKGNTIKTIVLLVSLITSVVGVAQNTHKIIIIGKTITKNNVPLSNTSVLDTKTKFGTKTTNNGHFQLTVPKKNTSIQFSYIGYHTIIKKITQKDIEKAANDTIYLAIILTPKITNLMDFQINSERIQLAYKEKYISIIDYSFHPKGLMLLLSINKKYKLRLIDNESNIISDLGIPKNPQKLFKDCLDQLHILYKDSCYQIYETKEKITLMKGLNIDIFNRIMSPCLTSSTNDLFFESYGQHNQSIIYYSINKKDHQKKLLHIISDKESLISTDKHSRETIAQSHLAVNLMGDHSFIEQKYARDAEEGRLFYHTILNKPIYNPLFKIRDSLFVFDHINDSVYIYDYNKTTYRTFPINYHYKHSWKKEIITDYSNKEVYAKMIKDGITFLLQINTDNGQIMNEYKLERHIFIDNIKVREGVAYYLFKDRYDGNIQRVYQQRLN